MPVTLLHLLGNNAVKATTGREAGRHLSALSATLKTFFFPIRESEAAAVVNQLEHRLWDCGATKTT